MKKIWAEILLDSLKANNIDLIFGYPGWANIPFYDKLNERDDIRHILTRHEQWAAFAAQWISRSKSWLGCFMATSWPWVANTLTWIMDAYMDNIPLICLAGQVPYAVMWNDVFQEMDLIWSTMSFSKHWFLLNDVNKIPEIINEAVKLATTWRPWPVVIDIPKDIQNAEYTWTLDISWYVHKKKEILNDFDNNDLSEIFKLVKNSKKPIFLIWQWVKLSNAEEEINELLNILKIPSVTTLLAKWVVREDNENYLWMLWMHWFYEANMAMANSDLIFNIWSRFDDRIVWTYDSFWKNAKIIHIDIDKSEINKLVKVDIWINSDAKVFITKFLEYITNHFESFILKKEDIKNNIINLDLNNWKEEINNFIKNNKYKEKTDIFSMKNACNIINKNTKNNLDKFMFSTDVWQHQMYAAQIIKVTNTKSWLTSGWSWTMWFALPTAIWSAVWNPDKTQIVIAWDWWIQMNIQELQVIAENNLDVKVIILNNGYLWMVRQWQDLFYEKNYSSTPIWSPDYVKLAWSYRIPWYKAESEEELNKILTREFNIKWPAVIEVIIKEKEWNIYPMVAPNTSLIQTIVE